MKLKVEPKTRDQVKEISRLWRALPRELKNDIRRWQRSEANPIWREEIASRPKTGLQEAVFRSGNSVRAGAIIELTAGNSARKMRGGGTPRELAAPAEFGTTRHDKYTRYYRQGHVVVRRTARGLPARDRKGYVAYPAAERAIKRIAQLAVQVAVRRIHEAAEGRG